jgi:hypothetical protein
MEQLFSTFTTLSDAYGMSITQAGCFTYVLNFPTEERTFEYNVATQLWNERATFHRDHWLVEGHIEAYGKHFVWSGTQLGYLDAECYAEFDSPQIVTLTSAPMIDGVNFVHFDRIEIDLDPGVGIVSGQGSDPKIILRYSDDGGKTWSPDYHRGIGKMGEGKRRVVWTRHGRSRSRVYQLQYSEPTRLAVYGAYVNEDQALAA